MTSLSTNIAILLVLLILLICHSNFFIFSCFHLIFQNPDSGPLGNVFKGKNPKNGKKMSYILHFERSPGRLLLLAAAVNASSDKL